MFATFMFVNKTLFLLAKITISDIKHFINQWINIRAFRAIPACST